MQAHHVYDEVWWKAGKMDFWCFFARKFAKSFKVGAEPTHPRGSLPRRPPSPLEAGLGGRPVGGVARGAESAAAPSRWTSRCCPQRTSVKGLAEAKVSSETSCTTVITTAQRSRRSSLHQTKMSRMSEFWAHMPARNELEMSDASPSIEE